MNKVQAWIHSNRYFCYGAIAGGLPFIAYFIYKPTWGGLPVMVWVAGNVVLVVLDLFWHKK